MGGTTGKTEGGVYRIVGAELSPYSVKVRSYFRYKGIAHAWVVRTRANAAEFAKHARLPLVPLVLAPTGTAIQDSTPIIEAMEAEHPDPSILPGDPVCRFISALLEEYADEWGNKHMFHYRWRRPADQRSGAWRLAEMQMPSAAWARLPLVSHTLRRMIAGQVIKRMVPRLSFVGSNDTTAPIIEASFRRLCGFLEAHLKPRPFMFGARPAMADFGLWGQIYNASTDPTPGAILRAEYPSVMGWIARMLDPKGEGDFEAWESLAPTLEPLLKEEVAGLFLPWTHANARALKAGEAKFSCRMGDGTFTQDTQKYHARSLKVLMERYAAVAGTAALDAVLARTGCLRFLEAA